VPVIGRARQACEPAQVHVATAMTMYRDMDMTYWLEQAEAEMRKLQQSPRTLPNSKDW
jgi:hypothetical protein